MLRSFIRLSSHSKINYSPSAHTYSALNSSNSNSSKPNPEPYVYTESRTDVYDRMRKPYQYEMARRSRIEQIAEDPEKYAHESEFWPREFIYNNSIKHDERRAGSHYDLHRYTCLSRLINRIIADYEHTPLQFLEVFPGRPRVDISFSQTRGSGIDLAFEYSREIALKGRTKSEYRNPSHLLPVLKAVREVNGWKDGVYPFHHLANTEGLTDPDLHGNPFTNYNSIAAGESHVINDLPKLTRHFKYFPGPSSIIRSFMRPFDRALFVEGNKDRYLELKSWIGNDHRFTLVNASLLDRRLPFDYGKSVKPPYKMTVSSLQSEFHTKSLRKVLEDGNVSEKEFVAMTRKLKAAVLREGKNPTQPEESYRADFFPTNESDSLTEEDIAKAAASDVNDEEDCLNPNRPLEDQLKDIKLLGAPRRVSEPPLPVTHTPYQGTSEEFKLDPALEPLSVAYEDLSSDALELITQRLGLPSMQIFDEAMTDSERHERVNLVLDEINRMRYNYYVDSYDTFGPQPLASESNLPWKVSGSKMISDSYDVLTALGRPLYSEGIVSICLPSALPYEQVHDVMKEVAYNILPTIVKQWPTATYFISYPIYAYDFPDWFVESVVATGAQNIIHSYSFARNLYNLWDVHGSGVIVINPPVGFEFDLNHIYEQMEVVSLSAPLANPVFEAQLKENREFPLDEYNNKMREEWEEIWTAYEGVPTRPIVANLTKDNLYDLNKHGFDWHYNIPLNSRKPNIHRIIEREISAHKRSWHEPNATTVSYNAKELHDMLMRPVSWQDSFTALPRVHNLPPSLREYLAAKKKDPLHDLKVKKAAISDLKGQGIKDSFQLQQQHINNIKSLF